MIRKNQKWMMTPNVSLENTSPTVQSRLLDPIILPDFWVRIRILRLNIYNAFPFSLNVPEVLKHWIMTFTGRGAAIKRTARIYIFFRKSFFFFKERKSSPRFQKLIDGWKTVCPDHFYRGSCIRMLGRRSNLENESTSIPAIRFFLGPKKEPEINVRIYFSGYQATRVA